MANKNLSPTTFVIFGASGDLFVRKILPAIHKLVTSNQLKQFCIIGTARSNRKFSEIIKESKKQLKSKKDNQAKANQIWEKIEQRSTYLSIDFNTEAGYLELSETIKKFESKHNKTHNRVFYLATLPTQYQNITKYLSKYKLAKRSKSSFSRIAYEKPFGTNQHSAKKINDCINKVFNEKQVYRIDHYLGKELVSNMALMRFTNRILEPLWSKKHIERVDIVMTEKIDIKNRANFYDQYGALKDVVQNHLLQLLALTAMEQPNKLQAKYIRDQKVKVIKKTKIQSMQLAQYQGYKKTKGIDSNSKQNTFAELKLSINNPRWKGVPFYLKTGKALNKKETYIDIKFKHVACLLATCPRETNHLIVDIKKSKIIIKMNCKDPSSKNQVTPIDLKFSENLQFKQNTPEAYETLLSEIILGDQSAFVRSDEVEASWKIIDSAIKKHKSKLLIYKKGSSGPKGY